MQRAHVPNVDTCLASHFLHGQTVSALFLLVNLTTRLGNLLTPCCLVTEKYWYCDDCDQTTADALKTDKNNQYFDAVDLNCPDGNIERFDISEDQLDDIKQVEASLPAYCREYCQNVFNSGAR